MKSFLLLHDNFTKKLNVSNLDEIVSTEQTMRMHDCISK